MTLSKLIKDLQKIEAEHGGRMQVCADTLTLRETCNDTWNIVNITEAKVIDVELCDGDGFTQYTQRGMQRTKRSVVFQ